MCMVKFRMLKMLVEFIEIQSLGLLKKEEGNIMVEEENNLRAEKIAPEK